MNDVITWTRDFLDEIESTTVGQGVLLWALGGPSFALRTPETLLWIDPYFGGTPPDSPAGLHRALAVPVDPACVRCADAVFSTHEHIDHCHSGTLLPIAAHTRAQFIASPTSSVRMLEYGIPGERISRMAHGDVIQIGDVHICAYNTHDPAAVDPVGFVLTCQRVSLFFAGDTQDTSLLDEVGKNHRLDVALLAYGEPWYMSAENLLRAAQRLNPRTLIPFHWEIWRGFSGDLNSLFKAYSAASVDFEMRLMQIGDHARFVQSP